MTNMPRSLIQVHLCLSLEASYIASICSKTEHIFIDYTHCQPAFKKQQQKNPLLLNSILLLWFVNRFQPLQSHLTCTNAGAKKGLKDHDHAVGKEQPEI